MTAYTPAVIVPERLKSMLVTNWDTYGGQVPLPRIEVINSVEEYAATQRIDYQKSDYIFISADMTGEQATPRDTFRYWDYKFNLVVLIYTSNSRQREYDLKDEIHRVVVYKMHDIANNGYQLVRWNSFVELNQEELKIWRGQCRISYESVGVYESVETP